MSGLHLSNCERTETRRFSGGHLDFFRFLIKCELPLSDFPLKTPLKNAVLVLSEVRGTGTA
nr:MAG TPA: hypothetical protein [Caudoviricetes sp.]